MIEIGIDNGRVSDDKIERRILLENAAAEERKRFDAIFLLAGFKTKRVFVLVNGYEGWSWEIWPPWYLYDTEVGLIKIGWRKRVIHIDWEATNFLWERPVDKDVSFGEAWMHAWGYDKALEYLKLLRADLPEVK